MGDAPKEIWVLRTAEGQAFVYDTAGDAPDDLRDDVKYIRADDAVARIEKLEAKLAKAAEERDEAIDRIEQLEAELAEARMQALSELGQAQEAYEAQKKAEAERDAAYAKGYEAAEQELPAYQNAAYKRGLEDAAKIVEERAREWDYCAENRQYLGLASKPVDENSRIRAEEAAALVAAIRARIQERDK